MAERNVSRGRARREVPRTQPSEDDPGRRLITERQAAYLAEISGVEAQKLVRHPMRELDELLRFRIDPLLLFFRKVCGRVVRKDPITGVVYGVKSP